ncbi:3724_t:CDS:2 [Entrophospora sp. SA101]|nr:3724_t:CDS:2 [Entrophospora sp. SA101]
MLCDFQRSKPINVVTKLLAKNYEYLTPEIFKHLRIHYSCQIKIPDYIIRFYGLTQNPDTKEVFMVMKYASHGDLDNNNPKIKILITDFSLSIKVNDTPPESIFGTLPYVAPEILCGKTFTTSSDVYSLGIIMTELSSGKAPYEDRLCDSDLALSIVSTGLRPVFREATPEIFINLAIECLNPSPEKRPTAETIVSTVKKWKADLDSKEDSSIKKSFLDSDKLLRTHDNQIIENKTPNSRSFYNKSLEFKNLPDHSSCKPPRTRIIRSGKV